MGAMKVWDPVTEQYVQIGQGPIGPTGPPAYVAQNDAPTNTSVIWYDLDAVEEGGSGGSAADSDQSIIASQVFS